MKTNLLILASAALALGCGQSNNTPTPTPETATPAAVAKAPVATSVAKADLQPWMTDLPAALALAKSQGKHVFMNFTGSDW